MSPKIRLSHHILLVTLMLLTAGLACGLPANLAPATVPTNNPTAIPSQAPSATSSPTDTPTATITPTATASATPIPPTPTITPTINLTPMFDSAIHESWRQVVFPGFGNYNNEFSDITQFGDHLYISTLSLSDNFVYSGSHNSGGEIWRSGDGVKWYMVADPGLGNIRNVGMNMAVFKNLLIVGGTNYIDGARLWNTSDGVNYTTLSSDGLGDVQNTHFNFSVYNDKLIISSCNEINGAGLWVSFDGTNIQKAMLGGTLNTRNTCWVTGSQPGVVFNGYLYYGTTNKVQGAEIWRTADGLSWNKVGAGGLGSVGNFALRPELVYNNQLYVLSLNYDGFQLFRTSDGITWEKVVDKGFGAVRFNNITCRLAVFNNQLYLITINQDRRKIARPIKVEQAAAGFQLYSSKDGKNWAKAAPDGFGNINNTTGELKVIGNQMYVETGFNYVDGSEVWRTSDGLSWQMIFKAASLTSYHLNAAVYPFQNRLYAVTNDIKVGVQVWQELIPSITTPTPTAPAG
ncbi:MAG TPA: hypothetical protein VKF38_16655 [Anaerolineaceae bacterium]|nr:hypothetical protein [Anaerolineaceae bacterium]